MKKIELYTAVTDSKGARREAGEVLTIGPDKRSDIAPEAAKALVESHGAVEFSETAKPVE